MAYCGIGKGQQVKDWIKRWGPAVLLMAIIFIASATPGYELPELGYLDLFAKKGGHMTGYGLLAAAYFHALSFGRRITRMHMASAVALALVYAVSDEWHQRFTEGRSPSVYDVLIDTTGALLGVAAWYLVRTRLYQKGFDGRP